MVLFLHWIVNLLINDYFVNGESAEKYTLKMKDSIYDEGVYKEVTLSNRIHCAAYCMKDVECKGFGFKGKSACSLLNTCMTENFCSEFACSKQKGIKIYMSEPEVTTTTKQPTTTSTTQEPTTTSTTQEPTTTSTTQEPTTTSTTQEPSTTSTTQEPTTTSTTADPTITSTTQDPTTTSTTQEPTTTSTTQEPTTTSTTQEPTTTSTTQDPTTTSTTQEPTTTSTTQEPTTTSTTQEPTTTSTTQEPTTTSTTQEPTTSTTQEPTTAKGTTVTPEPIEMPEVTLPSIPEIEPTQKSDVIVACKGEEAMQGIVVEAFYFDGEPARQITCVPYGGDIYANKDLILNKDIKPEEEFKCPDGFVIFDMTWHVEDRLLKKFDVSCRKLKADCIEKGKKKEVENSSLSIECENKSAMSSFKAKKKPGHDYEVSSICQVLDVTCIAMKNVPTKFG